jgi:gamma-glutamylcyclotransferase (GGCT)/AIG2-like uncharacterized protein YtfP
MSAEPTRLFVYGTLVPGRALFPCIAEHVRRARPATIQGVLVDLGAFPGLVPGDGVVKGVLLDIAPAALRITDQIEGHSPDARTCFYERREMEVELDDGSAVRGWTYFFARPESVADRPRVQVGERDGVPVFAWPPASYRQ